MEKTIDRIEFIFYASGISLILIEQKNEQQSR